MKITIEKKSFDLRFGYKALRVLGDLRGLETYSEVIALFDDFGNDQKDFTFEQQDLIEDLVKSAALADPSYSKLDYTIDDVVIIDYLMANQEQLNKVIAAFLKSFPQTKGNAKAQTRKRTRAK